MSKLPVTLSILGTVMVIVLTGSSADAFAQSIIGYSESIITVNDPDEERTHCGSQEIEPIDLAAKDLAGNVKKQIPTGSQLLLQGVVTNNGCPVPDYPVLVLFEVRDSDGITKYLAYQNVTLNPGQDNVTLGISWVAEEADDYTARLFTLHKGVRVLSPVLTYDFSAHG